MVQRILPWRGAKNPSTDGEGTNPGSFANPADLGGPLTFSSPDTPGMPAPSTRTAWDFLPAGWRREGARAVAPAGFVPATQLEHARLGNVTNEMRRVAEREPHLKSEQVMTEVAAGRMIVPANKVHLTYQLDAMAIGRASRTKVNANMGASPVSSSTDEEVEKLRFAERWGADTVMDLSTGGDLDACRDAIVRASRVPIGTVPVYSMIIGKKIEDLTERGASRSDSGATSSTTSFAGTSATRATCRCFRASCTASTAGIRRSSSGSPRGAPASWSRWTGWAP
jgi:phosphomethylpyrimidine synthase